MSDLSPQSGPKRTLMIQIVVTNCDFMSTRALADQPQVRRRVCGRLLDLEGPLEFTEHVVALRHLVPRQGVAPGGFERTGRAHARRLVVKLAAETPEMGKFPVNFPVSREFGAETGSHPTASSGTAHM